MSSSIESPHPSGAEPPWVPDVTHPPRNRPAPCCKIKGFITEGSDPSPPVVIVPPPPPPNDNFDHVQEIFGTFGSIEGTTLGATREAGEPVIPGTAGGPSAWYKWTAPTSGWQRFEITSPYFNAAIGVYTGTALNALTLVTSDKELFPEVEFSAVAGTTYYLAIAGQATVDVGHFSLNWGPSSQPNNKFVNAEDITNAVGFPSGILRSNQAATREDGEPINASSPGGPSVWFKWQSLGGAEIVFTLETIAGWRGTLGVYTGAAVNALTRITDSAAEPASVDFTPTIGVSYFIEVAGYGPDDHGQFRLKWTAAG